MPLFDLLRHVFDATADASERNLALAGLQELRGRLILGCVAKPLQLRLLLVLDLAHEALMLRFVVLLLLDEELVRLLRLDRAHVVAEDRGAIALRRLSILVR